jgi:hypothetical protein
MKLPLTRCRSSPVGTAFRGRPLFLKTAPNLLPPGFQPTPCSGHSSNPCFSILQCHPPHRPSPSSDHPTSRPSRHTQILPAGVMPSMKRQVPLERQMDVSRPAEKREHAEREAHDETEKIKISPGHRSPRAQQFTSTTYRCRARAGIRDADPATCGPDPVGAGTALLSYANTRAAGGCCPAARRSVARADSKPL